MRPRRRSRRRRPSAAAPVPAQLPPAVPAFAGRGAELASLDAILLRRPGAARPGPPRWSSRRCPAPPEWARPPWPCTGRTGSPRSSPTGSCTSTCAASTRAGRRSSRARRCAGSWTRSGCRPARIPAGLPAQAGLYRSLLAGKRVLVVLDNARDAEQVRPLLPGSPGCLAIVTSRNQLTGLVATEGAYPLTLDLLTAAERPGPAGPPAGSRPGGRRARRGRRHHRRCARLPLALAVAAARAATQPGFPAGRSRRRAARGHRRPGRLQRRRPRHRRPGGVLLVLPRPERRRGAAVPAARPAPRPGHRRRRRGQPRRDPARPSPRAAGRADPRAPARRARPRPVRLPRPAARLRRRTGPGTHDSQDVRDAAVRRILDHYLHTACSAATADAAAPRPDRPGPGRSQGSPSAHRPPPRTRWAGSRPSTPRCSPPSAWPPKPGSAPTPGSSRGP